MHIIKHESGSRGVIDNGWLHSNPTFSFADYYSSERMGFGALRVINDDIIAPRMGFDMHSHDNMEIISVPIYGALRHQDSMGNEFVISQNDIQVISAGMGIAHSEYNDLKNQNTNLLQIWVLPNKRNLIPRYGQRSFSPQERINSLQLIVSPDGRDGSIMINQNAYFSRVTLDMGNKINYKNFDSENGVYIFLIDGSIEVQGTTLSTRDGVGILNLNKNDICALGNSEILIMEVPLAKYTKTIM